MQSPEPAFYFALPRLLANLGGGTAARTEANWLEANAVGALVHATVYLFAWQALLRGRPALIQLLLAVPLAFVVWIFWILFFYCTSLLIRLVWDGSRLRAQSVCVGIATTCFALALIESRSWMQWIGWTWMSLVTLNLLAAGILRVSGSE